MRHHFRFFTDGKNVFLVETVNNDLPIEIACWCSLESAAVFNADHKVFLLSLHKNKVLNNCIALNDMMAHEMKILSIFAASKNSSSIKNAVKIS